MPNNRATEHISTKCYHCGEPIKASAYVSQQHEFCCLGCKTVFEVLSANELCNYYEFESTPGNTITNTQLNDEYAYLDNDAIAKELIDYSDHLKTRVRLFLPQIHCSSCIWLLENLNQINQDIYSTRVNFIKKEIDISFKTSLGLRKVVEQLVQFGYVPEINLNSAKKQVKKTDNTLYYKLGVAGFAFGNIMMSSFPEYLGIVGEFSNQFTKTFRYMNIALSLPVVFYSGSEYLQNAYNAIKTRILNLDVPIALGIFALFIRSLYEVISHTGSGYFDSLAGFIFFLLLGKLFQKRTYSALSFERDFKSFFPLSVNKMLNGKTEATKITLLEPGDIIELKNNEILPCDAVLLNKDANFDFSFVTGEAELVNKAANQFVFAGGKLQEPVAQLMVSRKAEESYLANLWQQTIDSHADKTLSSLAEKLGKYFTYAILLLSTVSLIAWLIIDMSQAFLVFTSVLIVACPCALALTIPFTYGTAMRVLAKNGLFLKDSAIVESMSQINHIVFDKTGTLTEANKIELSFNGTLSEQELNQISFVAQHSNHPLSRALSTTYKISNLNWHLNDFEEIEGKGIKANVNGDIILIGSESFVNVGSVKQKGSIHILINGIYRGAFISNYNYRKGLKSLFDKLKNNFKITMLSGDNDIEKGNLIQLFGKEVALFFNQQPSDKHQAIAQAQLNGDKVCMIGDGVNDASALQTSNLGISVTDSINNFTPASDAILKGDSIIKLNDFFAFSQKAKQIVWAGFIISFSYNLIGLSFAVQGYLSPIISAILMPLSSITIVLFSTLATRIVAKQIKLL